MRRLFKDKRGFAIATVMAVMIVVYLYLAAYAQVYVIKIGLIMKHINARRALIFAQSGAQYMRLVHYVYYKNNLPYPESPIEKTFTLGGQKFPIQCRFEMAGDIPTIKSSVTVNNATESVACEVANDASLLDVYRADDALLNYNLPDPIYAYGTWKMRLNLPVKKWQ